MKYWFFDGNEVVGPFTPKDLAQQKGFSSTSLICPENFSEDGDHWQMATQFEDMAPWLASTRPAEEEDTATFEQELDSLLKENSPFERTTTDGPSLELPKKPAKPGPIEDYFNHIKSEDLGDILGIPKPNENSDMDLVNVLEKQLSNTTSTRRKKQNTLQEPAAQEPLPELPQAQQTHHVATVTEVFGSPIEPPQEQPPVEEPAPVQTAQPEEKLSMPAVEPVTLPTLPDTPAPAPQPQPEPVAAPVQEAVQEIAQKQEPVQEIAQKQEPVQEIAPKLEPEELVEPYDPAQTTLVQPLADLPKQPTPAQVADERAETAEQLKVDTVNARLKQTKEMKEFLRQTQREQLKKQKKAQQKGPGIGILFVILLVIIIGIAAAQFWRYSNQAHELPAKPLTQAVLAEPIAAPLPPAEPEPSTEPQKAIAIVQNYPLSQGRGTLADYLAHVYQTQLAQGYQANWDAEQLHKNTYVVKYQLTKTRKEPIIYIFQVDVAADKLTGALNNVALDLVGKIQ
ncbi:MAG: hypothetical protein J6X06_04655 [Elusimicrobiaceae bacterium]|nr:hypothetical protein [Elusimicrobiaceae bacterium]